MQREMRAQPSREGPAKKTGLINWTDHFDVRSLLLRTVIGEYHCGVCGLKFCFIDLEDGFGPVRFCPQCGAKNECP